MDTECSADQIQLNRLAGRQVTAQFDGGAITSDAGVLLVRELEDRHDIVSRLAECFEDHRDPDYIEHSLEELLRQRIFGLVLGYEDLDDHDDLRRDFAVASACGKDEPDGSGRRQEADQGQPLAGSSTLHRLEMGAEESAPEDRYHKILCDLQRLRWTLVDLWLDQYSSPPGRVVIDLDATDVPLHGDQEEKFFHGYDGHYCYLPLYVFAGFWLLGSLLRFSGQDASADSLDRLHLVVATIRERWPETEILIRGDSGFARERIMGWCEEWDVDYVLGLAQNSRLRERIEEAMDEAEATFEETGEPIREFREFRYETLDSWSKKRRVVAKVEYINGGRNPRFVVTSLDRRDVCGKAVYETIYCQRGEAENRIKECQLDLFAGRTSSRWMDVNQLRVYFSSAAYLLVCLLRRIGLRGTQWAQAQAERIRSDLLKIGAQIRVTTRRVWFHLASGFPHQTEFGDIAERIRAGP